MKTLITKQVKRLKNPLFLLLLVVAIGLGAYFLSGTQFFKGQISDVEIATQNIEMEKIEKYVSVLKDAKGAIWPVQAGKETIFEVKDIGSVAFMSEKGYGKWRVLNSSFTIQAATDEPGKYKLTDDSYAEGTDLTQLCIDFGEGNGFDCSYETGASVEHTYADPGAYTVYVEVKDAEGRSDSSSKTVEVSAEVVPDQPPLTVTAICNFEQGVTDPYTYTFTGTAELSDGAEWPVEWFWQLGELGEVKTNTEQEFTITFPVPTTEQPYIMILTVTEPQSGATNKVECEPIIVSPPPAETPTGGLEGPGGRPEAPAETEPLPPRPTAPDPEITADFDYTINYGSTLSVTFFNRTSLNSTLDKVYWDFGNGENLTLSRSDSDWNNFDLPEGVDYTRDGIYGDTVFYHYDYPAGNGGEYSKDYQVNLSIWDEMGNTTEIEKTVTIQKPIRANFTCEINTTRKPTPVKFYDNTELVDGSAYGGSIELTASGGTSSRTFSNRSELATEIFRFGTEIVPIVTYKVTQSLSGVTDQLTDVDLLAKCDQNETLVQNSLSDSLKASIPAIKPVGTIPLGTFETPDLEDATVIEDFAYGDFKVSDYISGGETKEVGVMTDYDFVKAPAGSTVYFAGNCLSGEKKIKITPLSLLKMKMVAKPSDYGKAATFEIDPSKFKLLNEDYVNFNKDFFQLESMIPSAILDIFENTEACGEIPDEVTPDKVIPDEVTPDEVTPDEVTPEPLVLGTPEITAPDTNQVFTNTPRTVDITWTNVSGATGYDLELACDWCDSSTDKWENPWEFELTEITYAPGALPDDGEYRVRARAKNADLTGEWSNYTYFSFDTAPKYECNDGEDNDDDGYIDFGADPGCETPEDDDEENPPARIATQCSDGTDNDADGFIDLADIGCEDANDVNEQNETEPVKIGATFKQFCHDSVDPKEFTDITEDDYEDIIIDIIKEEASTAYNSEPFEGEPIFIGYTKSGETKFKPDQAIRRDEVIKIVELATCLPEHLKALDEFSTSKFDFDDPEFDNPNYWGSDYMYLAKNADIINKGNVSANVSRAEFLKILLNIHAKVTGDDVESCSGKQIPFVDVKENQWFCPYAVKAYEIGIAEGLQDKKGNLRLSPNSILTRMDAAIWLRNYYVAITGSSFADTTGGPTTIKPIEKINR